MQIIHVQEKLLKQMSGSSFDGIVLSLESAVFSLPVETIAVVHWTKLVQIYV